MFKLLSQEQQAVVTAGYQVLAKTHSKDGKPYILSLEAGPADEDARSKGYTYVSKTVFKDMEDYDFYDKDCEAHKKLKRYMVESKVNVLEQGVLTVRFTPAVSSFI